MKSLVRITTILLMFLLLVGCNNKVPHSDEATVGYTEMIELPTSKNTEITVASEELPFSLILPPKWGGRGSIQHTAKDATICIDGQPIITVCYIENLPDAGEKDKALVRDGYVYFGEDIYRFFYYKLYSEIPTELQIVSTPDWVGDSLQYQGTRLIQSCFRFNEENSACSASLSQATGVAVECLLNMKTCKYTNYRLGVSFAIPERMLNECHIRVIGERLIVEMSPYYEMCEFAVCDPESTTAVWYEAYGEHTLVDGTLYITYNNWQTPLWYSQDSWVSYPKEVKDRYSFEDVQQIVDSFQILCPPQLSGEHHKLFPWQYQSHL